MGQLITCISIGVYKGALTRGKQYELLAEERHQVKVRGDNHRTRWYPAFNFDMSGGMVPILVEWWFHDPVHDPLNNRDETNSQVEVTVKLSNGDLRWLSLFTPKYLASLLEPRSNPADRDKRYAFEPAIWGAHIVVIHDLAIETVDWTLKHIDEQGDLIAHSRLIEDKEEEGEDR